MAPPGSLGLPVANWSPLWQPRLLTHAPTSLLAAPFLLAMAVFLGTISPLLGQDLQITPQPVVAGQPVTLPDATPFQTTISLYAATVSASVKTEPLGCSFLRPDGESTEVFFTTLVIDLKPATVDGQTLQPLATLGRLGIGTMHDLLRPGDHGRSAGLSHDGHAGHTTASFGCHGLRSSIHDRSRGGTRHGAGRAPKAPVTRSGPEPGRRSRVRYVHGDHACRPDRVREPFRPGCRASGHDSRHHPGRRAAELNRGDLTECAPRPAEPHRGRAHGTRRGWPAASTEHDCS